MNKDKEFNSEDKKKRHAVVFMPEIDKTQMGGTMRLGARDTLVKVSVVISEPAYFFKDAEAKLPQLYRAIWKTDGLIYERHRHRYEVNPHIITDIEAKGMRFVGQDETGQRQEIVEIPDHPYYVG